MTVLADIVSRQIGKHFHCSRRGKENIRSHDPRQFLWGYDSTRVTRKRPRKATVPHFVQIRLAAFRTIKIQLLSCDSQLNSLFAETAALIIHIGHPYRTRKRTHSSLNMPLLEGLKPYNDSRYREVPCRGPAIRQVGSQAKQSGGINAANRCKDCPPTTRSFPSQSRESDDSLTTNLRSRSRSSPSESIGHTALQVSAAICLMFYRHRPAPPMEPAIKTHGLTTTNNLKVLCFWVAPESSLSQNCIPTPIP